MKIFTAFFLLSLLIPTLSFAADKDMPEQCRAFDPKWVASIDTEISRIREENGWMFESVQWEVFIPASHLEAIAIVESFCRNLTSSAGAKGCMQTKPMIMDELKMYGDLDDKYFSIQLAAHYLARLRDHYGYEIIEDYTVAYAEGPTGAKKVKDTYDHFYNRKLRCVYAKVPYRYDYSKLTVF